MEKTIKPGLYRIEIIDILRGFALLGIIIVHFTEQYYAGQPPASQTNFGAKNLADQIIQGVTGTFVQGKFFMIFSFLFGLSFHIQLDKSLGSSSFLLRFGWRLMVLFAIGFYIISIIGETFLPFMLCLDLGCCYATGFPIRRC